MNLRRWADITLIALFVGGISAFGAAALVLPPDAESLANENRKPAPLPVVRINGPALRKLPSLWEAYFNDRIALRESLLRANAVARYELGAAPTDRVLLGDDGWLFLNEPRSESSDGRWRDAEAQAKKWGDAFRRRGRWLGDRGIQYIVMLAPGKHDIYPEYVPKGARLSPTPSATEALRVDLRGEPTVHLLDLKPALLRARCDRLVYHRTDTHWNDAGALVAYRVLIDRLGQTWSELTPNDADEFEPAAGMMTGDLARMIRMAGTPEESITTWTVRRSIARKLEISVPLDPALHSPKHLTPMALGTGNSALPRAVFFHDSFADNVLLPALAEHFEILVSAPTDSFDPKLIEQFRPDVVIQEMVERKISWGTPIHPRGF